MTNIHFIPFQSDHLAQIDLQPAQAKMRELVECMNTPALVDAYSWTGLMEDQVCGCGGLVKCWPGHAYAWSLIGHIPPSEWVAVTNHVRVVLDVAQKMDFHRIAAFVASDFKAGHRWMTALGFEYEGCAKQYDPWGNDHDMYGRVLQCRD